MLEESGQVVSCYIENVFIAAVSTLLLEQLVDFVKPLVPQAILYWPD